MKTSEKKIFFGIIYMVRKDSNFYQLYNVKTKG